MKSITLATPAFRYLEKGFAEWLDILGYSHIIIYYAPLHVRELLYSLEVGGITQIKQLDSKHIVAHYEQLKERPNQKRGGALGNNALNKHIQAIKLFTDYLRQVGRLNLAASPLRNEASDTERITVLTIDEIQLLFIASDQKSEGKRHYNLSDSQMDAIQSRDRAMLSILYGCGLRRTEALNVNVGDINFDRSILHVKKGKNYKERFVPISKKSLKYLEEYVYDQRPELLRGAKTEALFLSIQSKRMTGQTMWVRLKYLQRMAEDADLMEKEIGLHTLRHSIATHLLQAGMNMESIARFLGHSSLESTQIYTHLAGIEPKEQPFNNIKKPTRIQLHEDEF